MSSLPSASAPVKPAAENHLRRPDTAGERELLLHALRLASARSRLLTNVFDSVGVSLRHKQIDCTCAMEWLRDEGALDFLDLGRPKTERGK